MEDFVVMEHLRHKWNALKAPKKEEAWIKLTSEVSKERYQQNMEKKVQNPQENNQWDTEPSNIEIMMAINSQRGKKSAPGEDRVDFKIIAELPPFMTEIFCEIVKESWRYGSIPQDWKKGRIYFLEKPEATNNLDETQAGFRRRRSTLDNLNRTVMEIKQNSREGKTTATAFIDIKGAYDNVDFGILLRILESRGCPKKMYADDIAIITTLNKIATTTSNIQKGISRLGDFLAERKLFISEEKTKVVFYGTNNKISEVKVKINNQTKELKVDNSEKFLGLQIDNKLNFEKHMDTIIGKIKKRICIIKYLCHGNKGIKQSYALMLTRALLSSVMEYAAPVY
ncbi:uncharacterized protein LOC128882831 [Hylaeus volcanicus]|uniref:uncharacterized protein LOC128882831 n=1 Tax=Hylaeus volcanicus TaxID=313075 RepID=UPI0023B77B02|nr:uncharacterized protein LOC128882831 [Hylaeus volcanicus]